MWGIGIVGNTVALQASVSGSTPLSSTNFIDPCIGVYVNYFNCLCCGKENEMRKTHANRFCNNACQQQYQFENDTIPKFLRGEISTRRTLIRCLTHMHGYKCVDCGNNGLHNNKPLVLQLDHTDGDASNDSPSNVRLLCPNCHSQTDTFVAKNKGKGRQARGLKR